MSVSPDSVPVRGLELAVPRSVKYAGVLLAVQALLWGLVAVAGVVALVVNARGIISGPGAPPHGAGALALDVVLLALTAGMAAVSALVVVGLRRRRAGARVAAIVLECLMTCFGVYLAWWSAGGSLLAAEAPCCRVRPLPACLASQRGDSHAPRH